MPKITQKALENKKKYLKPPSWQQIEKFISDLDVPYAQFERFFGMGANTLYRIKDGRRPFPMALWHYIYENKVPTYGLKSESDNTLTTNLTNKKAAKAAIKSKKKPNTEVFSNRFGR